MWLFIQHECFFLLSFLLQLPLSGVDVDPSFQSINITLERLHIDGLAIYFDHCAGVFDELGHPSIKESGAPLDRVAHLVLLGDGLVVGLDVGF